jgi:GYF domain 2
MTKYFILKNSIKIGPLFLEQLKEFDIKKNDLVWKEGNEDWIKAEEMLELSQILQPQVPKTPFEKKLEQTNESLKANFYIPIFFGVLLGLVSLMCWASVKSNIYGNEANSNSSYRQTSNGMSTPYKQEMDKYLAGEFGYSVTMSIAEEEDFYFRNSKQGIFRPIKAIFSIFNHKSQFFVGKNEGAPFLSFIFLQVLYLLIVYLIVFGIQVALHRSKT